MHLTQSRKEFGIAAYAVVILSIALQWYGHQGGLLQTPDSCSYIAATKTFEGYRYFPPLFPIILSVLGPYWKWIHLLLAAACLVILIPEIKKVIDNKLIAFICFVSIALSVHFLMIGVFLWSELLFLLLLLLFVKAIEKHFVGAIILGFFLCLQRNAGLFFVIGGAIWLWDLKRSSILLLLSSSGLIAWNIYAGIASEHTYFQSILHNSNVIAHELMRVVAPVPAVLLVVVVGCLLFVLKSDPRTRLISLLTIVYLVGMISIFRYESYDADRYIAVVVPFFMIILFRAGEIVVSKQTSAVRTLLVVLAVCWLVYPLSRTVKNAIQWHNVSFTSYFCGIQF